MSLLRHDEPDELGAAFFFGAGAGAERLLGLGAVERFLLTGAERFFLTGGDERLFLVAAGFLLVRRLRDGVEVFLLDEPEFTLLRRRRVLVVDLFWTGVLLLRRVLLLLVRRLLPLVELLVVLLLLLLLVLLRREEFLLVVVSLSSSESLPFLGIALLITRTALIGFTLMLAFLPVNLGRSGNFSTGIPSVACFINCRQV